MTIFASSPHLLYNHHMIAKEIIRKCPKVELHEHLDGSLRPETIIELAKKQGTKLPADSPSDLRAWFSRGSDEKSLPLYLKAFDVTTGLMQDRESLRRIAREEVEDLAADGVVYAEIRFAPVLHTRQGLTMEEVTQAVLDGLQDGRRETGMEFGLILSAMRDRSVEEAQSALTSQGTRPGIPRRSTLKPSASSGRRISASRYMQEKHSALNRSGRRSRYAAHIASDMGQGLPMI